MTLADYSGVALNQPQMPANSSQGLVGNVYQEFFLPRDYQRGQDVNAVIPDLSGFQVLVKVTNSATAVVDWSLQHYEDGVGWQTLTSGTTTGAPYSGEHVWFEVYFDEPVAISSIWLNDRFRLRVLPTGGAAKTWYVTPSPLTTFITDGTNPILDNTKTTCAVFRIMALTADSGTDFLGNAYRSAVVRRTIDSDFWMSKPNPSRFAVESRYFDMRKDGVAQVIDRVLIDPITPGVFFSVYYSNDGGTPGSEANWESKLWKRVPLTFQAKRRETHAFPVPITAKFIKLEFTHLQAKSYSPGDYQKEITYKKHPKWVLDYFLLRIQEEMKVSESLFVPQSVTVQFNALDLAYKYYLDDLHQNPDAPVQLDQHSFNDFLQTTDVGALGDTTTISKIGLNFLKYQSAPGFLGKLDYLPSLYTKSLTADVSYYPSEGVLPSLNLQDNSVSLSDRQSVVIEQSYPVMFFFLDCRHKYRILSAKLDRDLAYFVGIRKIQFDRDQYTSRYDHDQYIESAGDTVNVERNDFFSVDSIWQTYDRIA